MNKIDIDEIMFNKKHQFLYGYLSAERTKMLKSMIENYPITYDRDIPMAIFLESYGLIYKEQNKELSVQEKMMLDIISRDYLKNLVAYQIISQMELDSSLMYNIEPQLLTFLNSDFFSRNYPISSVKDYLKELRQMLSTYEESYSQVLSSDISYSSIMDFPNDFDCIENFCSNLKQILNNDGQFNIIIDYLHPIAIQSSEAIMSVVNSRCSGIVCMKIATNPERWPTYFDQNGYFAENIHDYGIVELDDSYQAVLKKSMKNMKMLSSKKE